LQVDVVSDTISILNSGNWATLVALFACLSVGYTLFGIAGFGAILIVGPILLHRLPLGTVVPLLAILDFVAAVTNGLKLNSKINFSELIRLVPLMAIGTLVGTALLIRLPTNTAAAAFGAFAIGYGIYGLLPRGKLAVIKPLWVLPIGLGGGVASGLFGSGGFIYALYLAQRLSDKDAVRATQSTLIGLAAATRFSIFLLGGAYSDARMIAMALAGLPALFVGLYLGHRISSHISRDTLFRVLCILAIATGSSLILRKFF
jgi:uncharacterized membrane protein YfcA